LEGGNNKAKRKAYGQNIERGYQKPHGHPLISKSRLHIGHLRVKPPTKKRRNEKSRTKRDIKDLDATLETIILNKGQTQEVSQTKLKPNTCRVEQTI